MVTDAAIRLATEAEIDDCVQMLTRAFADDALSRWSWPEESVFMHTFPRFCRAFGGGAFAAGTAHVAPGYSGAALWLMPELSPDVEAMVEMINETAPPGKREYLYSLLEQMEEYHPQEAHWHLAVIGVAPSRQGQGIGSALLRHALEDLDRQGITAYLEASSPDNARLYRRHGFEAIGRIQAGDSPEILPMLRRPR